MNINSTVQIENNKPTLTDKPWMGNAWNSEADQIRWVDPDTQLRCFMRRNWLGAWCGYVRLPYKHKFKKIDKNNINVSVHGGLSFKGRPYTDTYPLKGIWIGFDCSHYRDIVPCSEFVNKFSPSNAIYRTQFHVYTQCTQLAKQINSKRK